ncbi:MAG: TatD family hydrolase [Mycoplasmoidaceae bacterium]
MKYFDSHCHINSDLLLKEEEKIFSEIKKFGIGMNIVGYDLKSSKIAVNQAEFADTYATVGIHPNDINDFLEETKYELNNLILNSKKIISIGETGFDFYHCKKNQEIYDAQLKWLDMHFEIAKKYNLPLMIHVRNAHDEMILWLENNPYKKIIIHCFTENYEIAKKYISLGCYLSISGVITFKNAKELQKAVGIIPLDKMICETDSPFLAPAPHRGKINYPWYVLNVIKKISEIKKLDFEYVAEEILKNVKKIFNI